MKSLFIVLGLVIAGFICGKSLAAIYDIGYQHGKMEWERGIERTLRDLMQKTHPGIPFEWEGWISEPEDGKGK